MRGTGTLDAATVLLPLPGQRRSNGPRPLHGTDGRKCSRRHRPRDQGGIGAPPRMPRADLGSVLDSLHAVGGDFLQP